MSPYTVQLNPMEVSYALCERIIERDARTHHFFGGPSGWWRVLIDGRRFEGTTRPQATNLAACDLQYRLSVDVRKGGDA